MFSIIIIIIFFFKEGRGIWDLIYKNTNSETHRNGANTMFLQY